MRPLLGVCPIPCGPPWLAISKYTPYDAAGSMPHIFQLQVLPIPISVSPTEDDFLLSETA